MKKHDKLKDLKYRKFLTSYERWNIAKHRTRRRIIASVRPAYVDRALQTAMQRVFGPVQEVK